MYTVQKWVWPAMIAVVASLGGRSISNAVTLLRGLPKPLEIGEQLLLYVLYYAGAHTPTKL